MKFDLSKPLRDANRTRTENRTCRKCGESKPLACFYKGAKTCGTCKRGPNNRINPTAFKGVL